MPILHFIISHSQGPLKVYPSRINTSVSAFNAFRLQCNILSNLNKFKMTATENVPKILKLSASPYNCRKTAYVLMNQILRSSVLCGINCITTLRYKNTLQFMCYLDICDIICVQVCFKLVVFLKISSE